MAKHFSHSRSALVDLSIPADERYEIIGRIATGGMAEIYLSKMFSNAGTREVVLKRLMPDLQSDREFVQMFHDEAQIASQLTHPNVVQIYELGELDDSLFISMELLRGVNLRDLLARLHHDNRKIPIEIACRIVCGALEGLAFAHSFCDERGRPLNIIHRDVSPQNIIVTYDGIVKVLDFGVAKAEGKLHQTRAGLVKGKFAYMSPEQVNGEPLDGRADLFALTEVFYELLLHRHPFFAESDMDVLRLILDANPPHPTAIDQSFPPALADILIKAMKKDPNKRFADAQTYQREIEQFLIDIRNPATTMTVGRFVRDLFSDRMALEQNARERKDEDMLVKALTVGRAERWEMTGSALVGDSQMMAFGENHGDDDDDGAMQLGQSSDDLYDDSTEETELTLAEGAYPTGRVVPVVTDPPRPVQSDPAQNHAVMGAAMIASEDPTEAPTMMGEFTDEDLAQFRQEANHQTLGTAGRKLTASVTVEPVSSAQLQPIISRSSLSAKDPAERSRKSPTKGAALAASIGRPAVDPNESKPTKPQFKAVTTKSEARSVTDTRQSRRSKNQLEIWFFVLGLGALIGALGYAGILIFTSSSTIHLVVRSNPTGAEIWLDGFNTGYKTPKEIPNLSADEPHRIELKRAGYKPSIHQIEPAEENRGEPYVINQLLEAFERPKARRAE